MRLDTFLAPDTRLNAVPEIARAAEEIGFDAMWVAETQHNPFLPCALIAEHVSRLNFGTAIAVSFARSPAVMAHTAWDLADLSSGRFMLGLGTQVKAHIERRFGMDWPESPVGKLREQLLALRAFWANWQDSERLNQRGDYYNITLTTPFFKPPAIKQPHIPIFLAGVNTGMARLAGELAEGFLVHPYHSPEYLKETVLPAIEEGAAAAGRSRKDVQIVVNAFAVTNDEERAYARQQISFYASTPSYRPVMERHGLADMAEKLSEMAARKRWDEMPALVSDEALGSFATIAEEVDLAISLKERYAGIADRLSLYTPFVPGEQNAFWQQLVAAFNQ